MDDEFPVDADPAEPVCPTCHRTFETVQGMRVHHTHVHDAPLPNRTCIGCGESFYDERSELKYCPTCTPNEGENNPNWRGGQTVGTCVECGTKFEYYPSEKPGQYCSMCVADDSVICTPPQDHWGEGSTKVRCDNCDSEISVFKSKAKEQTVFFCNRDCYAAWLSETRRDQGTWTKADNPKWADGVLQDEIYGDGWFSARRAALYRDDFRCTRCGVTREELGQNPDVHHVKAARTFEDPPDAHALDNLQCLCQSCHMEVEEEGRKR